MARTCFSVKDVIHQPLVRIDVHFFSFGSFSEITMNNYSKGNGSMLYLQGTQQQG